MVLSERRTPKGLRVLARRAAPFLLLLLLLAVSGCALTMKVPQTSERLLTVPVTGHAPSHTSRDAALTIGAAKVGDIKGTAIYPAGLTAYGRMPDQTRWDYQYQVRDGQGTLRGECIERAGEVRFHGFGETTLDVSCRCFAGEKAVAELDVTRGAGKATVFGAGPSGEGPSLPDQRFAVFGTRGADNGKSAREILGYRFQSGKSLAAVDVTKASRAYYAESLSKAEQRALICLHAGLLLHRPRR